jgi:hypothetical protein
MTPPASPATPDRDPDVPDVVEARIARVLSAGAVLAVALLGIGLVLMAAQGADPMAPTFPLFDPAVLIGDLLALRPQGFLWAGILVVIATPIVRLAGEALAFGRRGEGGLALVAVGALVVVGASVVLALAVEG